jgi:hypothetical protein
MSVGSVIRPGGLGALAHRSHFARHLLEMTFAMIVGMVVSAAVFLAAVGTTLDEALRQYAVLFVIVQAFGMTVAMVAWMRHRGHAWRSCSEMAAAMVIPAIALIWLRLLDVISGPVCGLYCFFTFVAMIALMIYRRGEYGGMPAVASSTE